MTLKLPVARDEDVGVGGRVVHRHHTVTFHGCLERADRVDLGHPHLGLQPPERLGRALADLAVAGDHRDLAGDHHVRRPLDRVDQRLAAAVHVVELRLGHRVVHVDGREEQAVLLGHLVEAMDAGRRLLGDAPDLLGNRRVPPGPAGQPLPDRGEEDRLLLAGRVGQDGRVLLGPGAQVDQQRGVTAVVEDHVRPALAELEDPMGELPVLLQRLALAGEHRRAAGSDRRRRVVLGREDVAGGPADLGARAPAASR